MKTQDLRIAVLCGGHGSEASVSRSSGAEVFAALRVSSSQVEMFDMAREDVLPAIRTWRPDVVFPVLHGGTGENGTLQGWLEIERIPYVGSGILSSAVCMNKQFAKYVLQAHNLSTPKGVVVEDYSPERASEIVRTLGESIVVKPTSEGSALGVHFCDGERSLDNVLRTELLEHPKSLLVEERVKGKEITVGLLESPDLIAFPIIEIVTPQGSWYDFEHRYTPGLSEHVIPAQLAPEVSSSVVQDCLKTFRVLGCRDLARVDLIVTDEGRAVILEVNTLPGMTPTSLYPDGARAYGIDFESLVYRLATHASTRSFQ